MREVPTPPLEKTEPTFPEPRLLVVPEAWSRIFLQNLWGLFHSREGVGLHLESAPGAFWSDVFVERKLPWRRFLESGGYHILALIVVWAGPRFLALQPNVTAQPTFSHADVVYYTPSEYLPPLDTLRSTSPQAEKADPEFSAQPIISVPPEADNHSQTIVTAPKIQLQHDLPLPNTVAWSDKPLMPIAPAPLVPASEISRLAPQMDRSVIEPPPDVDNASRKTMQLPQVAVIAPPPALEATSDRRLGELNIGHSTVIAPAPQLYLNEQRTVAQGRSAALRGHAPQVIAPPPSVNATGGSRNGGGMIALSLHPAVGAPPAAVAGNRRGNFAATPEGHRGASGAPGGSTASSTVDGSASGKNSTGKLPSGLYVGKTANPTSPIAGDPTPTKSSADSVNPKLLADARPPHVSRTTQPESDSKISEAERAVFGNRKIYSLSLNMPNLNSAGGSWVIRFAALKQDSSPGNSSASLASSELSSPVAKRKVDPAYPLELMRQNVAGTVILYGVIHTDGTVGNVRVLRSVDDRLDQFASEAIAKCQFEPAMKNGFPVDVEATFWIPFRPSRAKSSF
jgi:TonB family protein